MDNQIRDIIFIGSGPSVVFGVLANPELLNKKCLIIEKGKDITTRDPNEVLFGFGGAGTFSDGKLVASPHVGGDITNLIPMTDELFYDMADQVLRKCEEFYDIGNEIPKEAQVNFDWMEEDSYEIPSNKLRMLKSKVCHIGTEVIQGIFLNMQEYMENNICPIHYEEEVINILPVIDDNEEQLDYYCVETDKGAYYTKKVVIGIGKRGNLVQKLISQFNLKSKPNKVQVGVRVEAPNIYMKDLIDKFYDYKVVMNTDLGRFRTFCACGSQEKSAYVAVEKGNDFYSVNGHSYKESVSNGLINFGIMGSLDLPYDKDAQVEWMKKVNGNTNNKIMAQNISDFLDKKISTKLNTPTSMKEEDYRLGNLWLYYPEEVCKELASYLLEFKKNFKLEGHFFAPEIKLVNPLVEMNEHFEVYPGLHLVGDGSGYARSIVQSGMTGMLACAHLNKEF